MAGQGDAAALAELGRQMYDASFRGEAAEAARLLDLHAPINHRVGEEQCMPLMVAALDGHIKVATLLANRGSDLEARMTNGMNALVTASFKGHLAVVQLLVERKADIEARCNGGSSTLMWASCFGQLAVVQYLASKCSSINTTDNFGSDACLIAAVEGFADIVLYLISKGGDPHPRPSKKEQQRAQKQFLMSWKAGCHPDARWLRRRGLMLMLAGCGFQPLACRKAQLKAAALPTDAKIPPLPNKTRRQKLALLYGAALGHPGLMKLVASFM